MNHTINLEIEQRQKMSFKKKLAGEEGRWEQKTLWMKVTVNHYGLYVRSSYEVKHRWFVPKDQEFRKKKWSYKSIFVAVKRYNNI